MMFKKKAANLILYSRVVNPGFATGIPPFITAVLAGRLDSGPGGI
jgi:hypothetical protein